MQHSPRLAFPLATTMLVIVAASHEVRAADEKEACLNAADAGQSQRDDGQYMSAREQFLSCARDLCPKLVHDQCTEWLRQLDEATPTVVFGARDQHGNDITAARVSSDGKLVTSNLDGKPVPLDPGPHDIRFEIDPNQSVTVHVVLRTGEKNREVSATLPEALPPPGTENPAVVSAESRHAGPARIIVPVSLLAGAAVAIGVGIYFGVQSQNEKTTADGIVAGFAGNSSACSGPSPSNPDACSRLGNARDAQDHDAVANYVLYAAGGALAAGAVATWLLWPKPHQEPAASSAWVAPALGPTSAGLRVGGSF